MEPKGLLLCSQECVSGLYPKWDESSLHVPTLFLVDQF
jgi:hypothetical protein